MISVGGAAAGVVASFAVLKSKVGSLYEENKAQNARITALESFYSKNSTLKEDLEKTVEEIKRDLEKALEDTKENLEKVLEDTKENLEKVNNKVLALENFRSESQSFVKDFPGAKTAMFKRLDSHAQLLTSLREQLMGVPSMKDVRLDFVSKDVYDQLVKYLDKQLVLIGIGISKILDRIEGKT
ncbi:hypothetical protein P0082_01025 [Candidatus Haliotispira prima]|uniref:Uncharacterized protein n=1 Tax=Candidatus Haliotispira prima TaxID=3034016 RepID=A0ABY8MHI7_9SPIO|nr:hypothetical protein P0082_01025 [Candidatus Haliotispira prima]